MIRCLTISDFNVDNFTALLANSEEEPTIEIVTAPFGQVHQLLVDGSAPCWSANPDCALVWTQPGAVISSFREACEYKTTSTSTVLDEVDKLSVSILTAAQRVSTLLVPSWTLPTHERGFGLLDLRQGIGLTDLLMRMNLRLAERLAESPSVFVLNAQRWVAIAGQRAFQPKLWYAGKVALGNAVFKEAVRDVRHALAAVAGRTRKLIIVDLDETLWGGIVGEVGWENLVLGGHHSEGEALVDFQNALKALINRGILLAIVSKNEEAVALEAIDRHPEMVLRRADFAGWRINWQDKARNVVDLAAELNLGLQSVVFIDDNPAERGRVAEALPEVLVPDWPADKTLYRKTLLELGCFDTATVTAEDRDRAKMYTRERERKALQSRVGSLDEWIESLEVRIDGEALNAANLARAAQLLNKTNQMNLTTRRMTQAQLQEWLANPQRHMWTFRVTDKFGALGLTGLLSVESENGETRVVDFVLSCRVFGRKVEEVMLATAIEHARSAETALVRARYLPTAKNKPCYDFFKTSGMQHEPATDTFSWNTAENYPWPTQVTVEFHR